MAKLIYVKLKSLEVIIGCENNVPAFHEFLRAPNKSWDESARLEKVVTKVDKMLLRPKDFSDGCNLGVFLNVRILKKFIRVILRF